MKSLLTNLTLWSLSLGHFCIDLFSGALPIVMVFMARALNLDLAQVGLVIGLYSLSTSLTQPIFGLLSDRYGGRWFAVGGLLWMALGYALVGFATSFPAVLLITTLAGFGSAAFHPQGASGANVASGDRKTAGVAVFMLGGNGGYALGPIVAAALLGAFGTHGTAVMGLMGLILSVALYIVTSRAAGQTARKPITSSPWKITLNPAYTLTAILALMAVMSLRAAAQSSFTAFVPQFFIKVGQFNVDAASTMSSAMLLALALGSLTGGILADRIGRWRVMMTSLLVSAPLMLLMILLHDNRAFLVAPLVGFMAGTAWPPMLVMAQELFPKNAGVGSGLALGFVFAVGGISTTLMGWVAEQTNLTNAMFIIVALPIAAAICGLFLPNRKRAWSAAHVGAQENTRGLILDKEK